MEQELYPEEHQCWIGDSGIMFFYLLFSHIENDQLNSSESRPDIARGWCGDVIKVTVLARLEWFPAPWR